MFKMHLLTFLDNDIMGSFSLIFQIAWTYYFIDRKGWYCIFVQFTKWRKKVCTGPDVCWEGLRPWRRRRAGRPPRRLVCDVGRVSNYSPCASVSSFYSSVYKISPAGGKIKDKIPECLLCRYVKGMHPRGRRETDRQTQSNMVGKEINELYR